MQAAPARRKSAFVGCCHRGAVEAVPAGRSARASNCGRAARTARLRRAPFRTAPGSSG